MFASGLPPGSHSSVYAAFMAHLDFFVIYDQGVTLVGVKIMLSLKQPCKQWL
jgi:hypothetical protein